MLFKLRHGIEWSSSPAVVGPGHSDDIRLRGALQPEEVSVARVGRVLLRCGLCVWKWKAINTKLSWCLQSQNGLQKCFLITWGETSTMCGGQTIFPSAKIRLAIFPSGKFPLPFSSSPPRPFLTRLFSIIHLIQKQGRRGCQDNLELYLLAWQLLLSKWVLHWNITRSRLCLQKSRFSKSLSNTRVATTSAGWCSGPLIALLSTAQGE